MTNGILNSIKYRDNMLVKLKGLSAGTDLHDRLSANLKSYDKTFEKLIRQAKIQYYADQFNKNKSNIRHTWSTIKEILNKCKKDFPAFFTLNGENIEDKTEISNTFNIFFASVGAKLSNSIEYNGTKTISSFLKQGLYHPLILIVSALLMWRKLSKIVHQRTVLVTMVFLLVF